MTTLHENHELSVPSLYSPVAIDAAGDATAAAEKLARSGADPATLVWARREDRLDTAVVLGPETPFTEALLVAYVTAVAIGDTLGALIPPAVPVTFGWPDRILLNGATVGGIRILHAAMESDAVPDWMVVGLQIAIKLDLTADPGVAANRTSLAEEGIVDVGAVDLLESFSRHFLFWINRWQDEGFAPVKTAWLGRAAGYGPNQDMELAGDWARRKLLWLHADGSVQYAETEPGGDGEEITATLADALTRPSWSF